MAYHGNPSEGGYGEYYNQVNQGGQPYSQQSIPIDQPQNQVPYQGTSGQPQMTTSDPFRSMAPVFNDPAMASAAMQYGGDIAKDVMEKNLDKVSSFLSLTSLKYYFAVDTNYVLKKLIIILFPFTHKDWSCKYSRSELVQPRDDINTPDLYIPFMAFVTYILLAGAILGIQNRFSPEELGILASSLLAWVTVEVVIIWMCLYLFSIISDLKWMDLLAFSGYKYVSMVLILGASILGKTTGYYISIAWGSLSIAYFLIQSLRLSMQATGDTGKNRNYLLMSIAIVQPILILWLTWGFVMYSPPKKHIIGDFHKV